MPKKELSDLPMIINEISQNPLKFIIFIDDLSFSEETDEYNALKAILEGSVSTLRPNVLIYATSNRRHLIKESFSDRAGDDIHRNETVQEMISLSDRFGLHVAFQRPTKEEYLSIVKGLLKQYPVAIEENLLERSAEAYAILRGSRSPRTAHQFFTQLINEKPFEQH